jgi:hypothetical protein
VSPVPVRRYAQRPCILVVCRGCCCGNPRKHPGTDHQRQLDRLRAAAEDSGGRLAVRTKDCLGPGEYVVIDMTAVADSFASGLFTRFDMTFLVAEPTRKGVSVYRQYRDHAAEFGVPIAVVGNKVTGPDDEQFLREHVGDDLLTTFGYSDWVRAREQGRATGDLEPEHRRALEHLRAALAFQNCHRVAAFRPEAKGGETFAKFTSTRSQILNQSPEYRDC